MDGVSLNVFLSTGNLINMFTVCVCVCVCVCRGADDFKKKLEGKFLGKFMNNIVTRDLFMT